MEYITDLIEIDQFGKASYNASTLDLILRCLNEEVLLKEMKCLLNVGTCNLATYINYFNKLKEYFNLHCNIIELGFGEFPIMSFLIDHEQQIAKRGTIHAFDGNSNEYHHFEHLVNNPIAPLGHINYHFYHIKENTPLPPYDLIFGIKACEGLIDLVKKANKDKKDFFLVPCNCYPKNFINYLYNLAKVETTKDTDLFIDDSIDKEYPILVRKKKQ